MSLPTVPNTPVTGLISNEFKLPAVRPVTSMFRELRIVLVFMLPINTIPAVNVFVLIEENDPVVAIIVLMVAFSEVILDKLKTLNDAVLSLGGLYENMFRIFLLYYYEILFYFEITSCFKC